MVHFGFKGRWNMRSNRHLVWPWSSERSKNTIFSVPYVLPVQCFKWLYVALLSPWPSRLSTLKVRGDTCQKCTVLVRVAVLSHQLFTLTLNTSLDTSQIWQLICMHCDNRCAHSVFSGALWRPTCSQSGFGRGRSSPPSIPSCSSCYRGLPAPDRTSQQLLCVWVHK